MHVLGIEVSDELLSRWRGYLGPDRQPFFVGRERDIGGLPVDEQPVLTDDERCTYTAWRVRGARGVVWLDENTFMAMPPPERAGLVRAQVDLGRGSVPTVRRWQGEFDVDRLRQQADGHRFVWWPSLLAENPVPVLRDRIEDGQLSSRHRDVDAGTWRRCQELVPGASQLVGRFPSGSGPNCFGAVMAAAGAVAPETRQVHEPFESFLRDRCTRGGADDERGTVLVWREVTSTMPAHAAITIGDGWALEKPAETWWTPTIVATAADIVRVNRSPGLRLERHMLRR